MIELHLPAHTAVLSRVLWDELLEAPRTKFDLAPDDLPFLHLYRRHATWVEASALDEPVCRDPDDDAVLATALAGAADAIVTGDGDLLTLESFRGIAILSPRQFIERVT